VDPNFYVLIYCGSKNRQVMIYISLHQELYLEIINSRNIITNKSKPLFPVAQLVFKQLLMLALKADHKTNFELSNKTIIAGFYSL
jgi:hypothetical protein